MALHTHTTATIISQLSGTIINKCESSNLTNESNADIVAIAVIDDVLTTRTIVNAAIIVRITAGTKLANTIIESVSEIFLIFANRCVYQQIDSKLQLQKHKEGNRRPPSEIMRKECIQM